MRKRCLPLGRILLSFLFAASIAWGVVGSARAEDPACVVTGIRGTAALDHEGSRKDLATGMALVAGDTITTGAGARVKLRFADGSEIRLGENATLRINLVEIDAEEGKRNILMSLPLGLLRAAAAKLKTSPGSIFEIHTGVGYSAVRGTHWIVDAQAGETRVFVEEGRVAVGADFQTKDSSKLVEGGHWVSVTQQTGVGAVQDVPPGTFEGLIDQTEASLAPGMPDEEVKTVVFTGTANSALGGAVSVAGATTNTVSDLAGGAVGAVGSAIGQTTGAVSNTVSAVGKVAGNTVNQTTSAVSNVTNAVGKVASNTVSQTTSAVSNVTNAVGNVAGGAVGQTTSAVSNVTGAVGGTASAAVGQTASTVSTATKAVGSTVGGALSAVGGSLGASKSSSSSGSGASSGGSGGGSSGGGSSGGGSGSSGSNGGGASGGSSGGGSASGGSSSGGSDSGGGSGGDGDSSGSVSGGGASSSGGASGSSSSGGSGGSGKLGGGLGRTVERALGGLL
jgi:hypothetical protein